MYPVLFPANATSFATQGLGALSSAIECTVTEERNGQYELFMLYPESGPHYSSIVNSAIIVAVPSDGATRQPFRVYKVTRPINGVISVYAQHISYQLSFIPVSPFTASSAASALAGLKSHALESCPFTFSTDIATSATYTQDVPESLRARLGGQEGSILDVYGGEFEWDGYDVRLWKARGTDRATTLRYGKNITDISQEENIESTYTGICPYWKNDEEIVTLPEGVIHSSTAGNFPFQRTIPVDLSTAFEEAPTVAQLRAAAASYISKNKIGIPKVSIKVSFVALWQTAEYKDIAPLERVKLCDTVQVYFEKLGIDVQAEIIATVYDVILERYRSIEIGEPRSTLSGTIADTSTAIETTAKEMAAEAQKAINTSTKLITGQKGGYVLLHLDPDSKKPYEILIMDTDDIETATKVWRWNDAGWGYSSNGYNGPYNIAATMDGAIVADFIKAGTMEANRIKGGELTLGGEANGNGVLYVKDDADRTRGKWANNGIRSLWYDPDTGMPKDFISINGDAGGVLMIRDVTQNSTIDEPVQSATGYTIEMYSNAIQFYRRSDGKVGDIDCNGATFTNTGTDSYSYYMSDGCWVAGDIDCDGDLTVRGQKDRAVLTDFGLLSLSAYETPTPYFGDIGSGTCDSGGVCYIDLDPRLSDVCNTDDYQVFISPYRGEIVSVDKYPGYFVVSGEPGATFAWEVKAKQRGYENNRFELKSNEKKRREEEDPGDIAAEYIIEQMAEAVKLAESEGVEE